MSTLDKLAQLGARRKIHSKELDGVTLNFRGLNHVERSRYRDAVMNPDAQANSDNLLVAMALCEPDGSPVGDENEVTALVATLDPVEVVRPLIDAILLASGIGKAAEDAIEKK